MTITLHQFRQVLSGCKSLLLPVLLFLSAPVFSQNIFNAEPVQWVGRPNGYSTAPYNSDYRTLGYRRISVSSGTPTDGRGQWATTINVQNTGGNITPDNMPGGGGTGWLLISGPSSNRFQNKWNFSGIGQAALNAINNVTLQTGGNDMGLNMGTVGHYTFVFRDAGYASSQVYIAYTQNAPVQPSVTGQSVNSLTYGSVISMTTNAIPSAGENIYVRYRAGSNDFTSGTGIVQATGSGTNWSAEIPLQACGSTVYYYAFTSTRTLAQLNSASEQDRSLSAIRYDDLSGANRSYVVPPAPTAAITGSNSTICSGGTSTISGTVNATGAWTLTLNGGGSTSGNGSGNWNITVAPTSTTTYTISSLSDANCIASGVNLTGSSTVTVNTQVGYANLQFPASVSLCPEGGTFTAYGRVYKAGVTEAFGQGAGIQAWLGYGPNGTNPNTWTNWVPAVYNMDFGSNDEYMGTLTVLPAVGTYSYAFRFQVSPCGFQYGGYNINGGGFWDGTTNVSGVLEIRPNQANINILGMTPLCRGEIVTYQLQGDINVPGTWSSSNTNVATITGSGTSVSVRARNAGTTDITYTYSTGCSPIYVATKTLTVLPNVNAGTISGSSTLCVGGTTLLTSNGDAGGSWISDNSSVATIDLVSGQVTAVSVGTAYITYNVNGCNGPSSAVMMLTVAPNPNAGTISGSSPLCIGGTATFSSNGDAGGSWSSDNIGVATVNPSTGLVTAVGAGTANITYTLNSLCNTTVSASASVTVNANVNAGTVSGTSPLCIGATATFSSNGDAGGSWSSDNTGVATVNTSSGLVTAIGAGTANITYTIGTGCGAPVSASASVTVNPNASAGTVSGTSSLCTGGTFAYSSNGNSGGSWSSDNTGVVTVNPSTGLVTAVGAGSANIIYTVSSGCNTPVSASATVLVTNGAAPVVTGPTNVCPFLGNATQVTYTASTPGATSYNWILPANVNLISGAGTSTITVTFNAAFGTQANKQIRVSANSVCGTSAQTIYYLLVQFPNTPGSIVASSNNVCPSIGTLVPITYTIPKATGATSYIWSAQSGTTTITHPNGLGVNDTIVTVTFTSGFTTSAITVQSVNSCGTSGSRSLTITRANPATPSLISGPTNVCAFISPGTTAASYSVPSQPTVTSYNWVLPSGSGNISGQGSNSISFIYPSGYSGGAISVTASNGCGTSSSRSLTVTTLNPAAPSAIDVINTVTCEAPGTDRVYTYSLSGMPANATSVQWTIPSAGTLVSGQGTTNITVSYPSTQVLGNVTATAVNNCGTSVTRSLEVKLAACPPDFAAGSNTQMKGMNTVQFDGFGAEVFPNPAVSDVRLKVNSLDKNSQVSVRIMDMQGRELKRMILMPDLLKSFGSDLKAGAYMIEVLQGEKRTVKKLIKL